MSKGADGAWRTEEVRTDGRPALRAAIWHASDQALSLESRKAAPAQFFSRPGLIHDWLRGLQMYRKSTDRGLLHYTDVRERLPVYPHPNACILGRQPPP
jgi:hypothetical protein